MLVVEGEACVIREAELLTVGKGEPSPPKLRDFEPRFDLLVSTVVYLSI